MWESIYPEVCRIYTRRHLVYLRCGDTKKLDREPILTLHCTSRSCPKGIREKQQFWFEKHRKRVRRSDTTQLWGSTLSFGQSEWDHMMRKMECIIHCMIGWWDEMRWDTRCGASLDVSLSTLESPEYILPVTPSISVSPLSPYTCHCSVDLYHPCNSVHPPSPSPSPSSLYLRWPGIAQSSAKLSSGGGDEKWILLLHGTPLVAWSVLIIHVSQFVAVAFGSVSTRTEAG